MLYWLYRNRERLGGGTGYAKDPVCGMQVQIAHAPATASHGGTTWYFCSDHCAARYVPGTAPAASNSKESEPLTQHHPG